MKFSHSKILKMTRGDNFPIDDIMWCIHRFSFKIIISTNTLNKSENIIQLPAKYYKSDPDV